MPRARRSTAHVTLQDIAEDCRVSVMTVSSALRGDRRNVSADTMERVRDAADRLGYDPQRSHAARRLRYSKSDTPVVNNLVGFHFSLRHIRGPYFLELIGGMGEALDASSFAMMTNFLGSDAEPIALPSVFGRGDVDGMLTVCGSSHTERVIERLRQEPGFGARPIVSLLEPQVGCSALLVNERECGYAVAAHLLDAGHRTALYVDHHNYVIAERIAGIRQAWADRGLDPDAHLFPVDYAADCQDARRQSLLAALAAHPQTAALIAMNDLVATHLAGFLRDAGLRIPDDISLVSFDDTDAIHDAQHRNILTSVRMPLREIGRQGAQLLVDRITGVLQADVTLCLRGELIVRGSVIAPTGQPRPVR